MILVYLLIFISNPQVQPCRHDIGECHLKRDIVVVHRIKGICKGIVAAAELLARGEISGISVADEVACPLVCIRTYIAARNDRIHLHCGDIGLHVHFLHGIRIGVEFPAVAAMAPALIILFIFILLMF